MKTGTISTRWSHARASSAPIADSLHGRECTGQRAALRGGLARELQRQAAALAVVGLGQVDELEVEGESAGEQNGAIERKRVNELEGFLAKPGNFLLTAAGFGVAALDGALGQGFDMIEKLIAGLLAENFSKQNAE